MRAHARRQPQHEKPPPGLAVTADGASRHRAAMSLQATAGNRAIAASLAEIRGAAAVRQGVHVINAVASTAAAPPGGAERIHTLAAPRNAAGFTSLPAPGAPDIVIGAPLQQSNGQWAATVNSTSVTPDVATSLYPGTGVHTEGQLADGTPVHRRITPAASDEIKRGEEEHLLDLEHARDLAYDRVADAVNRVAASGPAVAGSPDAARQQAQQNVRSAVPAKSRWPLGTDAIQHWRVLYGRLVAVTRERDSNRWHSINTTVDYDARLNRSLGIPSNAELRTYLAGSTQVGQHASGPLVTARYNEQPDGPSGTPVQPNQPTQPTQPRERTRELEQNGPSSEQIPADTFSPAGDYEYTPSAEYYAIREAVRRPARRS